MHVVLIIKIRYSSHIALVIIHTYLKLINNSQDKNKGNQHRDGVWICDETLA